LALRNQPYKSFWHCDETTFSMLHFLVVFSDLAKRSLFSDSLKRVKAFAARFYQSIFIESIPETTFVASWLQA
jgi:hypothetical protein